MLKTAFLVRKMSNTAEPKSRGKLNPVSLGVQLLYTAGSLRVGCQSCLQQVPMK